MSLITRATAEWLGYLYSCLSTTIVPSLCLLLYGDNSQSLYNHYMERLSCLAVLNQISVMFYNVVSLSIPPVSHPLSHKLYHLFPKQSAYRVM
jgi:hypothetical protein